MAKKGRHILFKTGTLKQALAAAQRFSLLERMSKLSASPDLRAERVKKLRRRAEKYLKQIADLGRDHASDDQPVSHQPLDSTRQSDPGLFLDLHLVMSRVRPLRTLALLSRKIG